MDYAGAGQQVELLHEVRLAEVEVDRALVDGRVRAAALDEAEQRARRGVDDGEGVGVRRAERRACRGVVLAGPDVARLRVLQLRENGGALQRLVAEHVAVGVVERRLERGCSHVAVEDARVRMIEDRGFDAAPEQRLRLAHEELVERVLRRDENGEPVAAAAGPAPLLAQ